MKRVDVINDFLEEKIDYYNQYVEMLNIQGNDDIDTLDYLFRNTLSKAWDYKE